MIRAVAVMTASSEPATANMNRPKTTPFAAACW